MIDYKKIQNAQILLKVNKQETVQYTVKRLLFQKH